MLGKSFKVHFPNVGGLQDVINQDTLSFEKRVKLFRFYTVIRAIGYASILGC